MIAGTLIAASLVLGYLVAVGLWMLATFVITKAAPGFVVKDFRLKGGYKLVHELVWLVCVTSGAYLSALAAEPVMRQWFVGALLIGIFVAVPWTNTWEVRQRGLGHQILMSVLSVAGVVAGFYLALR